MFWRDGDKQLWPIFEIPSEWLPIDIAKVLISLFYNIIVLYHKNTAAETLGDTTIL